MGRKFKPGKAEVEAFLKRKNELIQQGRESLKDLKEKMGNPEFPEYRKAFIRKLAGFYRYSQMNRMLIDLQAGLANFVQGRTNWEKLGRRVRKDRLNRKIWILRPVIKRKEDIDDDCGGEDLKIRTSRPVGYSVAYVYDVSDTEPIEGKVDRVAALLGMRETGTPAPGLFGALEAFAHSIGFPARQVDELPGLARGYCTRNQIVLKRLPSKTREIAVFAHEIGHALLHFEEINREWGRDHDPRSVRELEAEAVAYVCTKAWGIADEEKVLEYISNWQGTQEQIEKSFERIQYAASKILCFVEEYLTRAEEEPDPPRLSMKNLWDALDE